MVRAPKVAPFVVSGIALCPRCRRDVLPAGFRPSSLARFALRSAADGMVKAAKPDLKAERIKARKEKKRSLRSITKEIGIVGAVTLVLRARASDSINAASPASDDCPDCLKRQRRVA